MQEKLSSLLRTLLSFVGALLVGGGVHHLFGNIVDAGYWEEITGVVFALWSIGWSVATKSVDIEKLQGLVRQVLAFVAGILTAKGLINESTASAIIGFAAALLTWVQANQAKTKVDQLDSGKITVAQLKGNQKPAP